MASTKRGDRVRVHYTGKLMDGTVFDTSAGSEPLEFTIGEGQVIPGFEEAVTGMNPGERRIIKVSAEKAYGSYHEDMVLVVERDHLPAHIKPEVGHRLEMQQENGPTFVVIVKDMSESSVTLDANHPLAGKDLRFDIRLLEVVQASG